MRPEGIGQQPRGHAGSACREGGHVRRTGEGKSRERSSNRKPSRAAGAHGPGRVPGPGLGLHPEDRGAWEAPQEGQHDGVQRFRTSERCRGPCGPQQDVAPAVTTSCAPTLGAATPPPNTASVGRWGRRHQRHEASGRGVGEILPSGSIQEGFPEEGARGSGALPLSPPCGAHWCLPADPDLVMNEPGESRDSNYFSPSPSCVMR